MSKPDIFSSEQNKLLADNLNPKHVRTLDGKGYIEGWHAIAEANRIFGFGAWERETVLLQETNRDLVDTTKNNRTTKQWRVGYVAKVRITVHGEGGSRSREGTGFGSGYGKDNQLGEAVESAVKEAETDAMKRALSTFGNQFGLALYDKSRSSVGPSLIEDDDQEEDAGGREAPPSAAGADNRGRASAPAVSQSGRNDNATDDDKGIAAAIIERINKCQSDADVTATVKGSLSFLHGLKDRNPRLYDKIQDASAKMRASIKAEAAFNGPNGHASGHEHGGRA